MWRWHRLTFFACQFLFSYKSFILVCDIYTYTRTRICACGHADNDFLYIYSKSTHSAHFFISNHSFSVQCFVILLLLSPLRVLSLSMNALLYQVKTEKIRMLYCIFHMWWASEHKLLSFKTMKKKKTKTLESIELLWANNNSIPTSNIIPANYEFVKISIYSWNDINFAD